MPAVRTAVRIAVGLRIKSLVVVGRHTRRRLFAIVDRDVQRVPGMLRIFNKMDQHETAATDAAREWPRHAQRKARRHRRIHRVPARSENLRAGFRRHLVIGGHRIPRKIHAQRGAHVHHDKQTARNHPIPQRTLYKHAKECTRIRAHALLSATDHTSQLREPSAWTTSRTSLVCFTPRA